MPKTDKNLNDEKAQGVQVDALVRPKLNDNESYFVKNIKERAIKDSENQSNIQAAIMGDRIRDLIVIIERYCDHPDSV